MFERLLTTSEVTTLLFSFYPRDDMLARVLAVVVCLSVCPYVYLYTPKWRKLADYCRPA